MENKFDVLIIGSGLAGLSCALNLDKSLNIAIVNKKEPTDCNSYLAQGGISALKDTYDIEEYVEDTLKAGHYENNLQNVRNMIKNSLESIDFLTSCNVDFDKKDDNTYHRTLEGGHAKARIFHVKDYTGKAIIDSLYKAAIQRINIKFFNNTTMIDIIEKNNTCNGILAENNNKLEILYGENIVFATGGIGGLFQASTNLSHINGDGLSIAIRHKIKTKNIEYIQIHPTTLYADNKERKFLISEAVRGEGGVLLNKKGERFTDELKPRDVVCKAIFNEMKKDKQNYVNLSLKNIDDNKIIDRFPTIYNRCKENSVDITKESIKVRPGQHYHMGGIEVDENGKTSMDNLYAIGECACTGVHGKNRLASNSLLEAVHFGIKAAKSIEKYSNKKENLSDFRYEKNINIDRSKIDNMNRLKDAIKRKDLIFYEQWFAI